MFKGAALHPPRARGATSAGHARGARSPSWIGQPASAEAALAWRINVSAGPRSEPDSGLSSSEALWSLPSRPVSDRAETRRSEEHTSELQSLMRISYAVF